MCGFDPVEKLYCFLNINTEAYLKYHFLISSIKKFDEKNQQQH